MWPIGFGSALKPPWLECVTRTCWTASGVECVTPPEDDRDTLQRFTQPFDQPDKKVATRHLETSNDSPTRENDLTPPVGIGQHPLFVQSLSSKSSVPCPGRGPIPLSLVPLGQPRSSSEVCPETVGGNPSPLADFTPYAHQRRARTRVAKKYPSLDARSVPR